MDANFSFFVLPDSAGSSPEKLQLDTEGNPLRKRQPHHKSRHGCATCKRRKVKVCVLNLIVAAEHQRSVIGSARLTLL
jgi:hypothetical protein